MERAGLETCQLVSSDREFLGEPIRDPVVVVDYDGSWPARFEESKASLESALGPVASRVDHIGSTAVPGLSAKPVIDVQVSVADIEDESAYRQPLENLGYMLRFRSPEHRFFRAPEAPRTTHIHVVETGNTEARKNLLFVAYLKAHPKRRNEYAALKQRLAARFRGSRKDYLAGKAEFIQDTLLMAEQWIQEEAD